MATKTTTEIKEKFLLLKIIEAGPLQLALVRSLLADLAYIEVDNMFVISCTKSFKRGFSQALATYDINFIIIYVNIKTGSDVLTHGINESDRDNIERIVLDKK